jgi:hypothetical protein
MYIACPKCDWHHPGGAFWRCKCLQPWDTFATHGVCPACAMVHEVTQCPVCAQWSDHEEWYHDDDGLSVEEYIANPERARQPLVVPLET